jgi:hypothetical protein
MYLKEISGIYFQIFAGKYLIEVIKLKLTLGNIFLI